MSRSSAPRPSAAPAVGRSAWALWLALALTAGIFVAYAPAWQGGLLWDDAQHLTNPSLRPLSGLWRIWFELGATQQYYPLTHSVFWLEHRLWADGTLGYHLVNIALHAASACMLVVLLRRVDIPGGLIAAVLFALHPMHVESVAWITELKNTLSGALAMASALTYLHFDDTRSTTAYRTALLLFVLGLLSKSVVAPLPAVLLVLLWWRRGTIDIRRDVKPLVPFIIAGLAAGLATTWIERTLIGAQGEAFALSFADRVLVAGRAWWFYLATMAWPSNLMFNYPRWDVSAAIWWQWLFPLAVALVGLVCLRIRERTRAPLAAFLIYGAWLFPASGFINVYPFRFSFVADHFAYLASIPMLVLIAAAMHTATRRVAGPARIVGLIVLASVLAGLTYRQSAAYASAELLYTDVLARNPASWLAHGNLGMLALQNARDTADLETARRHLTEAVRLNPNVAEARNDLGTALQLMGRTSDAVVEYRAAIRIAPGFARPHANLATALLALNRPADAAAEAREAVRLQPEFADGHAALGVALLALGDSAAVMHMQAVVDLRPNDAMARERLALALDSVGRTGEAAEQRRLARQLLR